MTNFYEFLIHVKEVKEHGVGNIHPKKKKKPGLGIITIGYLKVAYDEFGPHLKKLYL